MNQQPYERKQFDLLISELGVPDQGDFDLIYEFYCDALESSMDLKSQNEYFSRIPVSHVQIILYIIHELRFYLMVNQKKVEDVKDDEKFELLIISLAVDKYFTNEHLSYKGGSLSSRFAPEISTITLYVNFILGMLGRYKQGDPNQTLVIDIMQKGFSMAKCIIDLLMDGFETEAFSTWRTLHENECILQVIVKYGQPVIERYVKHLRYAIAFRGGVLSKEETDKVFEEIKANMKEINLKSKDMKRYIEYGWLLGVPNALEMEDFKFNFRDGVERCADLRNYAKVYEMSSEIAHSSPLLIYSRKNYFYLITLVNLYESFFRLEKVFSLLYLHTAPKADQQRYLQLRQLYSGEILACYNVTKARFNNLAKDKK